jgi:EpsI family protein
MNYAPAIGGLGLLLAGVLWAHWSAVVAMVGLWSRSPMYSYGYTVPIISLYLLWCKRAELARLRPRPAPAVAIPVMMASGAMLMIGRAGGMQVLEQLSLLVALTAAVLFVFGVAYLRASWASLAYLLLMIPIWDLLTERLHVPFQNQSAAIGVTLLQLIGVPAHREGNLITLANVTLEVARACSGVNYLVAVVALALPLAYLFLHSSWRRVTLVISAMAIAALSNGLRVALIGVFAYFEIGSPLHGPFHVLHGLFVAACGYMALFVGVKLLTRGEKPGAAAAPAAVRPDPAGPVMPRWARAAAVGVIFAVLGGVLSVIEPQPVPLAHDLDGLPVYLGRWMADPGRVEGARLPWSAADVQLLRRYRNPEGEAVEVFIGYFSSQRQNKEVANHRSSELHRRASVLSIALPDGKSLDANFVRDAGGTHPALFWYDIDGSVETGEYATRLRTLWGALARRRTNGAVIMLSKISAGATREDRSQAELKELAVLIYEALGTALPRRAGTEMRAGRITQHSQPIVGVGHYVATR